MLKRLHDVPWHISTVCSDTRLLIKDIFIFRIIFTTSYLVNRAKHLTFPTPAVGHCLCQLSFYSRELAANNKKNNLYFLFQRGFTHRSPDIFLWMLSCLCSGMRNARQPSRAIKVGTDNSVNATYTNIAVAMNFRHLHSIINDTSRIPGHFPVWKHSFLQNVEFSVQDTSCSECTECFQAKRICM